MATVRRVIADVPPEELELFPQAVNSYSCDPCRSGTHNECNFRITAAQGDVWSAPCTCFDTAKNEHPHILPSIRVSAEDWKRLERDASWEGKTVARYLVDHALGRTRKGC